MNNLELVESFVEFGNQINEISDFIENSSNYNEYPREGLLNIKSLSLEFFDYQKIATALIKCYNRNKKDFEWIMGFLDELKHIINPEILLIAVIVKNHYELAENLIVSDYATLYNPEDIFEVKRQFPELFSAIVFEGSMSGEITFNSNYLALLEQQAIHEDKKLFKFEAKKISKKSPTTLTLVKF